MSIDELCIIIRFRIFLLIQMDMRTCHKCMHNLYSSGVQLLVQEQLSFQQVSFIQLFPDMYSLAYCYSRYKKGVIENSS